MKINLVAERADIRCNLDQCHFYSYNKTRPTKQNFNDLSYELDDIITMSRKFLTTVRGYMLDSSIPKFEVIRFCLYGCNDCRPISHIVRGHIPFLC